MSNVEANGINIEYEAFGDPGAPPLLLIMGLGTQMIAWDEKLCLELAGRNHWVIRFDNRDVGLSSKNEEWGGPDLAKTIKTMMSGMEYEPPYTIEDMAADAVGLLDVLGVEKAHVCGGSMGGFIAQTMALNHPDRVISMTSIYSHTGNPELPGPEPEIMQYLMTPVPEEPEVYVEHMMKIFKACAGPGFSFEEQWYRNYLKNVVRRSFFPLGRTRHLLAVMSQKNRKEALGSLDIPTLVVHGTKDPLVNPAGGADTAEAIPNAELLMIEGMGHDLPHGRGPWPRIIDAVAAHTTSAA